MRGTSILQWELDEDELSAYGKDSALLHIIGPACVEDKVEPQTGMEYTPVIHYVGNVTFPL